MVIRFQPIAYLSTVRWGRALAMSGLAVCLMGYGVSAASVSLSHLTTEARTLTRDWASGRDQAVEAQFDQAMRSALPAQKLGSLWSDLVARNGAFEGIAGAQATTVRGTSVVVVTVQFQKASEGIEWAFSPSGQVGGLHLSAAVPTATWKPPSYDHPADYTQVSLMIGQKPLRVPAVLDLPKGKGPFPGVVLVPGSGPENLNEQILGGPEEPFRDIAAGLASDGIAVLRYDKPTYSDPAAFKDPARLTPRYSDLVDALAAIRVLAHERGVTPGRVVVVGHSVGGYWAPWLAAHSHQVSGLVLLEAPTKPLAAYLVPQTRYLDLLNGPLTAKERQALRVLSQEAKRALNPHLKSSTPPSELPLGLPAQYWRFYLGYSPRKTAAHLSIPMLVVQGGRDYQVPPVTLGQWRAALKHHRNVTLHLFPTLDHLLVPVSGPSTPADYLRPGHVASTVIRTIKNWIRRDIRSR